MLGVYHGPCRRGSGASAVHPTAAVRPTTGDGVTDRPPDFTGDLDGYLAWIEARAGFNPDWCLRHWAPCPVDGKNGIVASILIVQVGRFRDVPSDLNYEDHTALNSWIANQTTPTCCRTMGDDDMTRLWALVDALSNGDRAAAIELKNHFGIPLDQPPLLPE